MPLIISALKGKPSFSSSVRLARILYTLLRKYMALLPAECAAALEILSQLLDQDSSTWKRALCMEVFRGIFSEHTLIRRIYAMYDAQDGERDVLKTLTATFVRISTEKPAVIGLGHQSSVPTINSSLNNVVAADALMDAGGMTGMIGGSVNEAQNVGISVQWSQIRTPCIDQLDKTDPPVIPDSYIYSLILSCLSSLSDGLAKFVLPLTVPTESRAKKKTRQDLPSGSSPTSSHLEVEGQSPGGRSERSGSFKKNPVPLNPLELEDHPLYDEIKICAAIVDECWPAILATCSTFLFAALDSEYYHNLVRAFQRFAHVAGLLQLSTPRDAFLTTLGKSAVPPNVLTACMNAGAVRPQTPSATSEASTAIASNPKGLLSVDSLGPLSPGGERRQSSADPTATTLNTRNLLCLRALLNLGIALGPTLQTAWSIILETLQQADLVLFTTGKTPGRTPSMGRGAELMAEGDTNVLMANFANEVRSVEVAASRLIESTVDFPNEAFLEIVNAVCGLLEGQLAAIVEAKPQPGDVSPSSPRTHRRVQSFSAPSNIGSNQECLFAVAKISEVASTNLERLLDYDPDVSGWDIITKQLISTLVGQRNSSPVRIRSAEVVAKLMLEVAGSAASLPDDARGEAQLRLLSALRDSVLPLNDDDRSATPANVSTDLDIHRIVLEGLRALLEQCGESLIEGWDIIFEIIGTVFISPPSSPEGPKGLANATVASRSSKLVRSSFGSLQLICSDFLSALPNSCFLILVNSLYNFSSQDDDLNIALTTVTFFWVLSDFLSAKSKSLEISTTRMANADVETLSMLAADSSSESSSGALWMLLLLRLTAVSSDDRLELRNSAIQTLLRIFDAYGTRLSSEAWTVCITSVVFKLLTSLQNTLSSAADSGVEDDERDEWHGTAVVVLEGISTLLANYIDVLTTNPSFDQLWRQLLGYFASLLDFQVLAINTATFKALSHVLSQSTGSEASVFSATTVNFAWDLWSRGIPISRPSATKVPDNQECLTAYVAALSDVYRLVASELTVSQVKRILELLRKTAEEASDSGYVTDVDNPTRLQSQILQAVELIRTDINGVPAILLQEVSNLVTLAFDQDNKRQHGTKKTYVALSRESIRVLQSIALAHASDITIYNSGALATALTALNKPIAVKYNFPITSKSKQVWQVATSASLTILEATLPQRPTLKPSAATFQDIWSAISGLADGILKADWESAPPGTNFTEDEDFDIASFRKLRGLIIPSLGDDTVDDKTRKVYVESLLQTSIIHAPTAADYAIIHGGAEQELAAVYEPRSGRTQAVPPTRRTRMAYVAFDELFALVSADSGKESVKTRSNESQWTKIACTAAPLVIVRCALAIRGYIADQPLRGKMPQPLSQKKELLWTLKRLVELKSANEAIPELEGAQSESRKHLLRLYPLLVKALAVRGDDKVNSLVRDALEVVGNELGVVY